MENHPSQNNFRLSRGGLVIPTSSGLVQFGVPPETIKDTMRNKEGVPRTFILPPKMFCLESGVSLAELEFPIYYNFFFKQQKIQVICTQAQQHRLLIVLGEALFGPGDLDYGNEFINGPDTQGYPDLAAELLNFKTMPIHGEIKPMEMDDVVEFILIEPGTTLFLDFLEIRLDRENTYTLIDQGKEIAVLKARDPLVPAPEIDFNSDQVFYPPLFGITTLGSGHGFAPDAMTSGMIIWINRRGIMVDPPVNAALELVRLGVPPKILDSIILTHCHADHDAGTLQKIMMEGSITLYTTPTIFKSFIRKSSALTNIPEDLLEKATKFVPLTIGTPFNINGGMFQFNYSLHSIPTISLQAGYGGKTMVYSSDTHNDPAYVNQLYKKGVVSESRRDFLNAFPWHRDIIFHEAGIPPLHTPMAVLTALPKEVRQRMYLVHVTQEMIPEGSDLKIAPTGLSATVELPVSPREFCQPIEILGTYLDQPLFRNLAPEKTMEFLCIVQPQHYKANSVVIKAGEQGEYFYMIMTGQVEIVQDGSSLTSFGRSDFFGEKCLFSNEPRTASAIAKSDIRLIAVHKQDMLAFIRNTPAEQTLFHLSSIQDKTLRDRLDLNPIFTSLTPSQKTQLFQILTPAAAPGSKEIPILREGEPTDACYFIAKGTVEVNRGKEKISSLAPGGLFGTWIIFDQTAPSPYSFLAGPDLILYQMAGRDLHKFAKNNPGVLLKLYTHDI